MGVLLLTVLTGMSILVVGCSDYFVETDNGWNVTNDYSMADSASKFKVLSAKRWNDKIEIKIGFNDSVTSAPDVAALDTDTPPIFSTRPAGQEGKCSFIRLKLRPTSSLGKQVTFVETNDALNIYYGEEWPRPTNPDPADNSIHGDGPVYTKTNNYEGSNDDEPTSYLIADHPNNRKEQKFEVKLSYGTIVKTFTIDYSAITSWE
ncbi:hypothetical protein AGMMS49991_02950 [Spirochaetia bacterium]|nr:hypothetical protein AGMMS49991_02950 [Spirochaetia bacterium]